MHTAKCLVIWLFLLQRGGRLVRVGRVAPSGDLVGVVARRNVRRV